MKLSKEVVRSRIQYLLKQIGETDVSKLPEHYFQKTSSDTYAFMALAYLKIGDMDGGRRCIEQLEKSRIIKGQWSGWGLNNEYNINGVKLEKDTIYSYTSNYAIRAYLRAYEVLENPVYLKRAQDWVITMGAYIGLHKNGMLRYTDNKRLDYYVPNVSASAIGVLANLYKIEKSLEYKNLASRLFQTMMESEKESNWSYTDGRREDAFHMGMILEGLYYGEKEFGFQYGCERFLEQMVRLTFNPGVDYSKVIRLDKSECYKLARKIMRVGRLYDIGSIGWGPSFVFLALNAYDYDKRDRKRLVDYMVKANNRNIRVKALFAWALSDIIDRNSTDLGLY